MTNFQSAPPPRFRSRDETQRHRNPAVTKQVPQRENEKPVRKAEKASINSNKQQSHFEFESSTAGEVFIAGSFNDWRVKPLEKVNGSTWAIDLPLEAGRYEYRLVVDGNWQEDPKCLEHTLNPFYSYNSILVVQ